MPVDKAADDTAGAVVGTAAGTAAVEVLQVEHYSTTLVAAAGAVVELLLDS